MDIKRIRHVLALAEEKNFNRAAAKCHLSQPAFSRSIQVLEQELGMALFDRSRHALAVTPAGVQFIERARRVYDELHELERDMALTRDGVFGTIHIGAGPLPAANFAQPLLQGLIRERPGLRLSLIINSPRQLLASLENEEIELFVADTQNLGTEARLSITPLVRQTGPFVCRAGHPLLLQEAVTLRELLPYRFASLNMAPAMLERFHSAFQLEAHEELPVAVFCNNMDILRQFISDNDVILITSHAAMSAEIAAGRLVPLHVVDSPPLYTDIGIVQLKGRTVSPAAKVVIQMLKNLLA